MSEEYELYKKYRPTLFKHVRGQAKAVSQLETMLKKKTIPGCMVFYGPSGCGKTTLARLVVKKLGVCFDKDFTEINAADERGIDMVRKINKQYGYSPIGGGPYRVWLIDEAHKLTNDAQNSLLKMLEDTPKWVLFMLATTEAPKLIQTIRTRSTEIPVSLLKQSDMKELVLHVCTQEKKAVSEDVLERLIEVAEGSARKALVILHQIIDLKEEKEQLDAIQSSDARQQAIMIARLLFKKGCSWAEMSKCLKEIDEEAETIRRIVLAYARSILLGGSPLAVRANNVIAAFRDNFYDCGDSGLAQACYEVVVTQR